VGRADPPLGARVNVVGTVNVFEAVRRRVAAGHGMAPVVYTGSIGMYSPSDVDSATARNLVDSMTTEVVVQDDAITRLVPGAPIGYDDAVRLALADRERATRHDRARAAR